MTRHAEITAVLGTTIYFCDPHSPWQRPSNENTNGLLRAYFPKSTDLSVFTAADIARVQTELNLRPRKVLGWDSPADRLAALLGSAALSSAATATDTGYRESARDGSTRPGPSEAVGSWGSRREGARTGTPDPPARPRPRSIEPLGRPQV